MYSTCFHPISDRGGECTVAGSKGGVLPEGSQGLPWGTGGTARVASWGMAGACQNTEVPLGNQGADNQDVPSPAACRKRHTWAPQGSWSLGCAGRHRESCHAAVVAGKGNSRNT